MPSRRGVGSTRRSALVLVVVLVIAAVVLVARCAVGGGSARPDRLSSRAGPATSSAPARASTAATPTPSGSDSAMASPTGTGSPRARATQTYRPSATTGPSTAASPRGSAAGRPLSGMTIALDPGHNRGNSRHLAEINRQVFVGNGYKACNTVGTSTDSGYSESRFTMAVALDLRTDLNRLGATVKMTRTSENPNTYGPCVNERGLFGGRVHADLEVSLHGDGEPADLRGFQVIAPGAVPRMSTLVRARSNLLQQAIASAMLAEGEPAIVDHGRVSRTDLGTLNLSTVPVVLVELGNMRNSTDASIMTSPAGQRSLAGAVAAGIRSYAR